VVVLVSRLDEELGALKREFREAGMKEGMCSRHRAGLRTANGRETTTLVTYAACLGD
jgi:hypothetical protein